MKINCTFSTSLKDSFPTDTTPRRKDGRGASQQAAAVKRGSDESRALISDIARTNEEAAAAAAVFNEGERVEHAFTRWIH